MLAALATTDDLAARHIAVPDGMDAATVLGSASAAIREAAGCSITYGPSTVTIVVDDPCEFDLPAGPVASVDTVAVDTVAVTGWRKVGDTVYLPLTNPSWWGVNGLPVEVTVTYTHGYPVIPEDIVDLCCSIAAMAFAQDGSYGEASRVALIQLGDYREGFIHPAGTESPSPIALPDSVRDSLRARFGTNVGVLKMR